MIDAIKSTESYKKYSKKIMPFLGMLKERTVKAGNTTGLDLQTKFDELTILKLNETYLKKTLELVELQLVHQTDNDADGAALPTEPSSAFSEAK